MIDVVISTLIIGKVVAEFVVLGVIGWWVYAQWKKHSSRRKLREFGFSDDDFESGEKIYSKWAEITTARLPDNVTLQEIDVHRWSEPQKHADCEAEMKLQNFIRRGVFRGLPAGWVAEVWSNLTLQLCGVIVDGKTRGVRLEVLTWFEDGTVFALENTDDCGFQHFRKHVWVHCGQISPAELVSRALRERPAKTFSSARIQNPILAYEHIHNESLAWRKGVGISGEEMKRALAEHRKAKRQA